MSVLIYLVIAVVVGGGASFAAENSLPGDVLYGVKTGVNEKVMAAFATTAEAKANFEARTAGRRLEEMERLSAKGKVDANVAADLQENFQAHADRAELNMTELDSVSALEVASNFESSLRAHSEIFTKLQASETDDANVLASLSAKINNETNDVLRAKVKAEGEISVSTNPDVKAAAEGKLMAAESKLAEVRALIEAKKASLGAEATVKAEADLRTAEGLVVQGKAKLEGGAYGEAFILFQEAHQEAQEARLLLDFNIQINSDLRVSSSSNSSIETDNGSSTNGGIESKTNVEGRVEIDLGL